MNSIREMMEKYQVQPRCKWLLYSDCGYDIKKCNTCEYMDYPDFTVEKQFEILRFIGRTYSFAMSGSKMVVASMDGFSLWYETDSAKSFSEALARIMLEMYLHINSTQIQEVKEILEDETI